MTLLLFLLDCVAVSLLVLWTRRRPEVLRVAGLAVLASLLLDVWGHDWHWAQSVRLWLSVPLWTGSLLLALALLAFARRSPPRLWIGIAGAVCGICLSLLAFGVARLLAPFELPALTGEHEVARMQWVLRSPVRADAHNPDPFAAREFMVDVYYPTVDAGLPHADYMPAAVAESQFAGQSGSGLMGWLLGKQLGKAESRAHRGGTLSPKQARYPVVVFSPGLGFSASMHTYYLEQLASHGYAVFAVSHPGDVGLMQYPDGRQVRNVAWSTEMTSPIDREDMKRRNQVRHDIMDRLASSDADWRELVARAGKANVTALKHPIEVRKQDMIELLDVIQRLNDGAPETMFAGRLDMDNIAVTGMSYGGPTAQAVCLVDSRCKAIVNMDGEEYGPVPLQSNRQPALWFYTVPHWEGTPFRRLAYDHHEGPAWRVGFEHAAHGSFADFPYVFGDVGWYRNPIVWWMSGEDRDSMNRDVPPKALAYLVDFLDHQLKGKQARLLEGRDAVTGTEVHRRQPGDTASGN